MTFNPQSMERLKALGRNLPKELPKVESLSKNKPLIKTKLEPNPTKEEDPESIFHEIIDTINSDEKIPPPLIDRLKRSEEISRKRSDSIDKSSGIENTGSLKNTDLDLQISKQTSFKKINHKNMQYASFSRLLLEEDD